MNDPILTTDHDDAEFKPHYATRVAVTGSALAHGHATDQSRSAVGAVPLELRMPEELGGDNLGPNPEQFFAAGYAACFHGALSMLARRHLLDPESLSVEATVAFGRDPADGGYQLRAELVVTWPGVTPEVAAPLLAHAAVLCPYAKMTRGIPASISFVS